MTNARIAGMLLDLSRGALDDFDRHLLDHIAPPEQIDEAISDITRLRKQRDELNVLLPSFRATHELAFGVEVQKIVRNLGSTGQD